MPPLTDAQRLRLAAQLIKFQGLAKNILAKARSHRSSAPPLEATDPRAYRFCVRGAICRVANVPTVFCESKLRDRLDQLVLKAAGLSHTWALVDWNNHPKTKAADVVAVLYKAAELAEQRRCKNA